MKTRELVFQYPDGSYPGLYRVGIIEDGLGSVDWSPATIDMSGNMQLPGNLDVSGSAVVDGTLTVGSTIYALSDVAVDGDLDVSGSLTVSSIETCGLSAAQGRFTVDCSYGYVSIQPNNGFPPGFTGGSFNDSRIELYCGITAQRSLLRLFAQERYDDNITEARIVLVDSSGQYIAPAIQFDGSEGELNILSVDENKNTFTALTVDLSYGYLSLYPNLGLPPGGTLESYYDTRIDMYGGGISGDPSQYRLRLFTQRRPDTNIPEARIALATAGGNIVTPQIQFDASAEQLRILNLNPNEEVAIAVDMSGNVGVGASINPQTTLDVGGTFRIDGNPPAGSTAAGVTGQIAWDENYLYVCVAGSSWARVGIAGW